MSLIDRAIRQLNRAEAVRLRHGIDPQAPSMRQLDRARANLKARAGRPR